MAATTGMRRVAWVALLAPMLGCTSVDPGPDFVLPQTVFNANYFYCHVEPEFILAPMYSCGSGDPSKNESAGTCHFNSSVVTGMPLINHPLIDCGGGDVPLDLTTVAIGSPAQSNLQAVSLEMSTDYTTAPLFVRPSSYMGQPPVAHPRAIFDQSDTTVQTLLLTWATK